MAKEFETEYGVLLSQISDKLQETYQLKRSAQIRALKTHDVDLFKASQFFDLDPEYKLIHERYPVDHEKLEEIELFRAVGNILFGGGAHTKRNQQVIIRKLIKYDSKVHLSLEDVKQRIRETEWFKTL